MSLNNPEKPMNSDLITRILDKYFIKKGKTLEVIQRYLSVRYKLIMDKKVLQKRIENLSSN
jgi:protein-arginine kinase activator protein McsA